MNLPRISIITITFNSEKTLEETIKSVINQGYPNLEYIIIDGGSKDGTLSVVDKYRPHISKFISESDKGISDAFNKGIALATGEIIGIINSDDLLLSNALHYVAEAYTPQVSVYRGKTIIWDEKTNTKIEAYPSMKFPSRTLRKFIVCHQSTFVTKAAYERCGCYKETFKYMMDVDLLMRLYQAEEKFCYIPKSLAVFRLGGVTNSSYKKKIEEVRRLFLENGAGVLWTNIRVLYFVVYNLLSRFSQMFLSANLLRKIKFYLVRN